jgi:4-amino-4-deoxy-L-arabinose transferase-like glycosyltransferase
MRPQQYFIALLSIVLAVTAIRIYALYHNGLDLMFDEAQYWYWAQTPAWGYFSKPPLVAWAIGLSTRVCGEGEACVRLASPLAHAGASVAIFLAARTLYGTAWPSPGKIADARNPEADRIALWSAITYLTVPAVAFSSTLISTDPLLLCAWAWTLYFFIRALGRTGSYDWALAGMCLGLGLLSKYAMLFFLPLALLALWTIRGCRHHLRTSGPWLFMAIGLAILLPNILWNLDHGWVSVAHTKDNAKLAGSLFNLRPLWSFFSAQFAVFGPVLFAVLLTAGLLRLADVDPRTRLLQCFSVPYLGFYLALSFVSRAHANWAAPAYIAATILVVAWLVETKRRRRWLVASLGMHLTASAALMTYPWTIHALGFETSKRNDLFWRQRGQRRFGAEVANLLARHPGASLMSDSREIFAPLIYYVEPHPFGAVKWDRDGVPHDHYELVGRMNDHVGKDFLLVTEAGEAVTFAPYFDTVTLVAKIQIPVYSNHELAYRVYRLTKFKGLTPTRSSNRVD